MVSPVETEQEVTTPEEPEVGAETTDEEVPAEAEGVEGESTEESAEDWQKTVTELKAELDRVTKEMARKDQQLATVSGSVRRQSELEALLLRQGSVLDALTEHISDPDSIPENLKARVASIKAQEATEVAVNRNKNVRDGWLAGVNQQLRSVGMSGDDPRLSEAIALWNEGDTDTPDLVKLHQSVMAVNSVLLAAKDAENNQKVADAVKAEDVKRRRANAANGTMSVGASNGVGAAGVSDQELVNRVARRESLTTAEWQRANAAMDRGIYPNLS